MFYRATIIFTLIMILSTASLAAASQKDAAPDCKNPVTQLDMNMCASDAYKQSDKKLNDLYGRQLKALQTPATKNQFRDMQKAWLKFRDKSCDYETSPWEGGSIQPLFHLQCLKRLTDQRIKDLETYLSCTQDGCPN